MVVMLAGAIIANASVRMPYRSVRQMDVIVFVLVDGKLCARPRSKQGLVLVVVADI